MGYISSKQFLFRINQRISVFHQFIPWWNTAVKSASILSIFSKSLLNVLVYKYLLAGHSVRKRCNYQYYSVYRENKPTLILLQLRLLHCEYYSFYLYYHWNGVWFFFQDEFQRLLQLKVYKWGINSTSAFLTINQSVTLVLAVSTFCQLAKVRAINAKKL